MCAGDESCSSLYDDREVKYCTGKLKALFVTIIDHFLTGVRKDPNT